jgi:hypothetical protein
MAPLHFPLNGSAHPRRRPRFSLGSQAPGYLFEAYSWKPGRWTEKNPVSHFFDGECRARPPIPRNTDSLGQNDLALR